MSLKAHLRFPNSPGGRAICPPGARLHVPTGGLFFTVPAGVARYRRNLIRDVKKQRVKPSRCRFHHAIIKSFAYGDSAPCKNADGRVTAWCSITHSPIRSTAAINCAKRADSWRSGLRLECPFQNAHSTTTPLMLQASVCLRLPSPNLTLTVAELHRPAALPLSLYFRHSRSLLADGLTELSSSNDLLVDTATLVYVSTGAKHRHRRRPHLSNGFSQLPNSALPSSSASRSMH